MKSSLSDLEYRLRFSAVYCSTGLSDHYERWLAVVGAAVSFFRHLFMYGCHEDLLECDVVDSPAANVAVRSAQIYSATVVLSSC